MKNCPDELAEQISLRENADFWRSDEDEKRTLAGLAKYFTEKEKAIRAHQPDGAESRKPGRPASVDGNCHPSKSDGRRVFAG
jgi:hypothetical protein